MLSLDAIGSLKSGKVDFRYISLGPLLLYSTDMVADA
jgi:hypothetical protein